MRTLKIIAKCSDLCSITFQDEKEQLFLEKQGYVPKNLGIGGGDYVRLVINIDNGNIVSWKSIGNEEIIEELEKI